MKNYLCILFAILIISLSSCKEKVDFDLNTDENARLVVEGSVTDQAKAHVVNLTRTSSYYENQPAPRETGATVTLFDGETYHNLVEAASGIYKTAATYKGEIGKTYTLNIVTKDGQSYSSSSKLESVASIDSVLFETKIYEEGDEFLVMKHYGEEPSGVGNNYMWLVDINGFNYTEDVASTSFVTDELVDGNYIDGFEFKEIHLFDLPLDDTLKFTIEMHSISRDYYDFLSAIILETEFTGELFSGPPANIPSNISNGGLGFFRASAVSAEYLEIVNE